MNNESTATTKKYELQENFNYSFDYSEFVYSGMSGHQLSVFKPALKASKYFLAISLKTAQF
jgi:hypothetical protein